jgi:hypothetical protein
LSEREGKEKAYRRREKERKRPIKGERRKEKA